MGEVTEDLRRALNRKPAQMPEFYRGTSCRYQLKAQPFLDAIARGIRDQRDARAFVLEGTKYAKSYADADVVWREQWAKRDPTDSLQCPFWSNYWYGPCRACNCRIDRSVSMEIDAIFFLRDRKAKTLAIHIEMKRDSEALSLGQAEAYRPRARCYRDQRRIRETLLPHDHFITVLFCGVGADIRSAEPRDHAQHRSDGLLRISPRVMYVKLTDA
jgi:hypothetical protein